MPTVQIPTSELLRAVRQLNTSELEEVAAEVLALRGKQLALQTSESEESLLALVRRRKTEAERRHYEELVEKRQREVITEEEFAELRRLTDQDEQSAVVRLQALYELARRRGKSIEEMSEELGLKGPGNE
jgi:hypothetical protein